jgi:hypothetical protein
MTSDEAERRPRERVAALGASYAPILRHFGFRNGRGESARGAL